MSNHAVNPVGPVTQADISPAPSALPASGDAIANDVAANDTLASASQQAGDAVAGAASLGDTLNQAAAQASTQASDMGFLNFIGQSDAIGKTLFVILLVMSLVSWYLILVKAFGFYRMRRRSMAFLEKFWNAGSLDQVQGEISIHGASEPFSHLAAHGLHAKAHHHKYGATRLEEAGSQDEFMTRTLRKVIDEETTTLENGLTVLATIGSTAPFVGLFGTVWGVYHALVGIGLADGVTINKIAGPVGEALIMTGLGLAVAIPAVIAFNAFVRKNRVYLSRLDAFAHDLFAFLTTGQQVELSDGRVRALNRAASKAARQGGA